MMSNSWTLGTLTFAIDTSTNVAGLTALKGSAPTRLDTINHTAGTLTVESALEVLDYNGSGSALLTISTGGSLNVAPSTVTHGATTAQLVARTRNLLPEPSADLWGNSDEVLTALNEGVGMLFADLNALPSSLTAIDVTANTATYALPVNTVRVNSLWWNPTSALLTPYSTMEYEDLDYTLRSSASTPFGYIYDQPSATGAPQVILVPPPSSSATGGLTGTIFSRPAALTLTGVNPTWHAEFHYTPCYWAACALLL
ncbi:MAG: hypothetical protein WC700_14585, partial [Gemmatimonadaceae bacterium]